MGEEHLEPFAQKPIDAARAPLPEESMVGDDHLGSALGGPFEQLQRGGDPERYPENLRRRALYLYPILTAVTHAGWVVVRMQKLDKSITLHCYLHAIGN